jgi:hypothetical protein
LGGGERWWRVMSSMKPIPLSKPVGDATSDGATANAVHLHHDDKVFKEVLPRCSDPMDGRMRKVSAEGQNF